MRLLWFKACYFSCGDLHVCCIIVACFYKIKIEIDLFRLPCLYHAAPFAGNVLGESGERKK